MARYCLGAAPHRPADKTGLLVVHDPAEPRHDLERWSFAALDDAVRACAAGLRGAGLEPGDRLVLRMGNRSEVALLFFGALAAGIVAVPTSSQLTEEEVGFVLDDTGAAALAVGPDLEVSGGPTRVGPHDVARWVATGERAAYRDTAADDPAFLVYTSGTSGVPKGVLHAHRSAWGRRPMYAGWHGLGPDDVMVHAGAFNWTYTLGVGLTDPWAVGASAVVVAGAADPGAWPRVLAATGATLFAAVPGVYRQLLDRALPGELALPSLRHGLSAGEALAPSLWRRWREASGRELYEALGMSEISTFVSSSPTVPTRPGSPGRPQEGRRVAVLPAAGADGADPLPLGQTGLLAVHRSDPGLMLGYWQRTQEESALRGEWFVSGDLVHIDGDGYVVHHGRADDVMTSMGYRVSPLEVEHCIARHPGVAEVGVAETVVREGVSLVTAFVVPVDRALPPAEEELIAYARTHLAGYKCPRRVVVLDRLPRTANGKIRREQLRGAPNHTASS
jgi:acyl-coenzyme A synthetase/AMP-(fatty) acid ligase